jgi:hypothetical protein
MKNGSTIARLAGAAFLSVTAATGAQAEWLQSDGEIKTLVSGKRVYLKVPLGGEFPLYYAASGKVTGDGSALGLGKFLAPRETGRWWVSAGKLCQQFPSWYDGETKCFRLAPTDETRLRWRRDDGYSGRARIAN